MKPFEDVYIAHRGLFNNNCEYPENSLPAFKRAVENKYGIELDVQLTKDDKMVVFHDEDLLRMCGVNKLIRECTYEELQKYSLGKSNEKIPLFVNVLKIIDGKVPLIVEVKPEGKYLETTIMLSEIMKNYDGIYCIESFHPFVVAWYKKHKPDILRGQLSTNYFKDDIKRNFIQKFLLTNLLLNIYSKPDFIAYNHKYTNQISYRICRKLYKVENVAWTIKNNKEFKKAKKIYQVIIFDSMLPTLKQSTPSKKNT